jgi:hypothetical protein
MYKTLSGRRFPSALNLDVIGSYNNLEPHPEAKFLDEVSYTSRVHTPLLNSITPSR